MSVVIQTESPPLRYDASGALRIGNSRVLLELVVPAFQDGATPETIVQRFPSLQLADVYGVIAYYLRHREEIDRYVADRRQAGDETQQRVEARQPDLSGIRQRLLARRTG